MDHYNTPIMSDDSIDLSSFLNDTIVAVATPPGRGGVGIVRLSGGQVDQLAETLLGKLPAPRVATHAQFKDAENRVMDFGLALRFKGPNSFTGEDVLELHGHGGPVPMDMLVSRCLELGARMAQPGEFSQRAFLNNKIDLTQAEAISDLIDSASQEAARAAVRSLGGEFSKRLYELAEKLTSLRMYVEAAIDFPEEEIDFLQDSALTERLSEVESMFESIRSDATQGALLRDGMVLVITGRPNVGKSSLLNRLAGYDAAIVTSRPGTTRDVLREDIHIDGMPLRIIDTAGLHTSDDPIELEGMRRAREALSQADHVLLLIDDERMEPDSADENWPENVAVTRVVNKIDITGEPAGRRLDGERETLFLSAVTGQGVDELRSFLSEQMGYKSVDSGRIIARRRHLRELELAYQHLNEGKRALLEDRAGEIMAEELRLAQGCLGEITGEITSDDLLGQIFSSFCIGK